MVATTTTATATAATIATATAIAAITTAATHSAEAATTQDTNCGLLPVELIVICSQLNQPHDTAYNC